VQGAHGLVHALAHLQQQQHLVDGRVRPPHQDQLLLHALHLAAVGDARPHAEPLHGGVALQAQQVPGQPPAAAVTLVGRRQSFLQVGPQRPEHAGEHGPLQRQV